MKKKGTVLFTLATAFVLAAAAGCGNGEISGTNKNTEVTESMENTGATEGTGNTDATETHGNTGNTEDTVPGNALSDNDDITGDTVLTDSGILVTDIKSTVYGTGITEEPDCCSTVCISSVEELLAYYENYKAACNINGTTEADAFGSALMAYDETFFEQNDLLVAGLISTTGSAVYTVTGVEFETDRMSGNRTLQIILSVTVPDIATDDMAGWHITVEISKAYGAGDCSILDASVSGSTDKWYESIGTKKSSDGNR